MTLRVCLLETEQLLEEIWQVLPDIAAGTVSVVPAGAGLTLQLYCAQVTTLSTAT